MQTSRVWTRTRRIRVQSGRIHTLSESLWIMEERFGPKEQICILEVLGPIVRGMGSYGRMPGADAKMRGSDAEMHRPRGRRIQSEAQATNCGAEAACEFSTRKMIRGSGRAGRHNEIAPAGEHRQSLPNQERAAKKGKMRPREGASSVVRSVL